MARLPFLWAAARLNLVFFGGLVLWTLTFLPYGFLAYTLRVYGRGHSPKTTLRNLIRSYGSVCCRLLAGQTDLTVVNKAGALPRPCIIAANHQSFFDPYCIALFPVFNPVFMVRSWPFRIPLYGRIMRRAGYLDTESLDAHHLLHKARALLAEGAALVVFPEGTRGLPGALGRFRSGAFAVAVACDVPVIPLCIDGTGRVFPKGSRLGAPAAVRITLLPPIAPSAFRRYGDLAHRHLQKQVKLAIQQEMEPSSHVHKSTVRGSNEEVIP